jgi:tRNA nucleotidyltransferase (CCA-adding enzyme)
MKQTLLHLATMVNENAGTAYSVGGSVRDDLLGIEAKDQDVEIFGIPEDKLARLLTEFAKVEQLNLSNVGKSFKVWKLRNESNEEIDISLPRVDKKIGVGHKGFEITADPFTSVKLAASRRDITINAIYKNILTGELLDPFNGRDDLYGFDGENNTGVPVIRMVDERAFAEDPLRVLRAIQFASRFGAVIDHDTKVEMLKADLSELPTERIWGELEKILMKSPKPSVGLWHFAEGFLTPVLFPEIAELEAIPQDKHFHPEGNVLIHTMMAVDVAAELLRKSVDVHGNFKTTVGEQLTYPERLTVLLAVLAHDFGKVSTTDPTGGKLFWDEPKPGVFIPRPRVTAHGHASAGIVPATAFLDRLNIHTVDGFDVRGQVLKLVEHHLAPPQFYAAKEKDKNFGVAKALRHLAATGVRLDLLAIVSLADMLGRSVPKQERIRSRDIIDWFEIGAGTLGVTKSAPEPLLKGRHLIALGVKPGPEMGDILKTAYQLQLDGNLGNFEQAQAWVHNVSSFGLEFAARMLERAKEAGRQEKQKEIQKALGI